MKDKKIEEFLRELGRLHTKSRFGFTVLCERCGSSNVTIYHGCEYYYYSSYTSGFDQECGLKCKDCGNASNIEVDEEEQSF